jgi:glycosyltransferase involved in cell wall biosynthesis
MYLNSTGLSMRVAVVIPAYKVSRHILEVVRSIPPEIDHIVIVDDACPEGSGELLRKSKFSKKVSIIKHEVNLGVGGAMKSGYKSAVALGADIVVKIDGDGQMDSSLIPNLIKPILSGDSDYTKGNRFYSLNLVREMPKVRLVGNVVLSFMSKLSTGFYHIFDPNNGFTAVSAEALALMDFTSIDDRYFFESDMLYQLNAVGMRAIDVPTPAIYRDEISNLRVGHSIFYFFPRHIRNMCKRITLNYFIRDFSVATLQLVAGILLAIWGSSVGLTTWIHSKNSGIPSQPGTIVLVAILCITSLQLLLSFINYDISLNRRDKS